MDFFKHYCDEEVDVASWFQSLGVYDSLVNNEHYDHEMQPATTNGEQVTSV